jgi:hypothetical protein
MVVHGQSTAAASAGAGAGSPSPDVILVSENDPMTDLAGKVQWFEPFEIRRPKGFLEITVRIIQGLLALFLSLVALTIVVANCIQLVKGGQRGFQQDLVFAFVFESAILLLATLMVFVAARRFLYWKVDQAGIHQHWFGFRNWSLAWNEIASRRLGPMASPAWLFLVFVPIAGGQYQPIILEDRRGRKRKVNRLGTNGDRLDAILRPYLSPTGEARQAQTYSDSIQRAQAIHSHQDTAQVPLHLCTRDSPVVRMRFHEPKLLPVCCNCLGPKTVAEPISTSPGLIGFFNDNFLRLLIPLCSDCQARMHRRRYALFGRVAIALGLVTLAIIAFSVALDQTIPSHVFFAIPSHAFFVLLGSCFIAVLLAMLWHETRHPSAAKLVKVVEASSGGDWMDVRFGNPDYARLVDELNGMNPNSGLHRKDVPHPKAAGYDSKPEV